MKKQKRLSFEKWIEREGVVSIVKHLGVTQMTVSNWKNFKTAPQVKHMRAIKRLTKGEIGYEQMIDRRKADRALLKGSRS